MGGLEERLGGKGTIQFETSKPKAKSSFNNSLIDTSVCVLFAVTIGISCIAEFKYSQGSLVLILGLIICGIWMIRARKHDNIPTAPDWYPIIGHFINVFQRWYAL